MPSARLAQPWPTMRQRADKQGPHIASDNVAALRWRGACPVRSLLSAMVLFGNILVKLRRVRFEQHQAPSSGATRVKRANGLLFAADAKWLGCSHHELMHFRSTEMDGLHTTMGTRPRRSIRAATRTGRGQLMSLASRATPTKLIPTSVVMATYMFSAATPPRPILLAELLFVVEITRKSDESSEQRTKPKRRGGSARCARALASSWRHATPSASPRLNSATPPEAPQPATGTAQTTRRSRRAAWERRRGVLLLVRLVRPQTRLARRHRQ